MNILTTRVLTSALFAVSAGVASTAFADAALDAQIAKSTDVKGALINACKTETAKGGKLTAAEVAKYCSCAIESEGKVTNAQKWQMQSTYNQKKPLSSLPFVQQQNQALKTCFGPQLTTKLQTLANAAAAAQPKK